MNFYETPSISFPGIGIDSINPDPVAFRIGSLEIRWYGLLIALGMILAAVYVCKRAKSLGLTVDNIIDAFCVGMPLAIIGARIFYCLFYKDPITGVNPYFEDPVKILYIWEGGLMLYGSVVGACLGLVINAKACKKAKRKKLLPYFDMIALGLPIGQCIGRWGNFMNREAFGAEITGNWFLRMGLTEGGVTHYWHPTFLYESVWNLGVFLALHFLSKKRKYDGQTFLQYLLLYGVGRAIVEGLRTDSLYIGTVRVSQLVGILCAVISLGLLLYIRFRVKPAPERMLVNQLKLAPAGDAPAPETAEEPSEAETLTDAAEEPSEAETLTETEGETVPAEENVEETIPEEPAAEAEVLPETVPEEAPAAEGTVKDGAGEISE